MSVNHGSDFGGRSIKRINDSQTVGREFPELEKMKEITAGEKKAKKQATAKAKKEAIAKGEVE